jgi:hypothetical protein
MRKKKIRKWSGWGFLGGGVWEIVHSIRNYLQFIGEDGWFTRVGHKFGFFYTDGLLKILGKTYQPRQEIYFFWLELVLGLGLVTWGIKVLTAWRKNVLLDKN